MGFLDNLTTAVNRGTASVQRSGRSVQLKMQLNDLAKERRDLAAQLGASLYDVVKDDPALREGREPLFDGIAAIDQRRAAITAEIEEIEAENAAQAAARMTYQCPQCGAPVAGDDLFCSGCGLGIAEIRAAYEQPVMMPEAAAAYCASCGAPMAEDDLFCMNCGARAGQPYTPEPGFEPQLEPAPMEQAPVPGSAPVPASGRPAAPESAPAPDTRPETARKTPSMAAAAANAPANPRDGAPLS